LPKDRHDPEDARRLAKRGALVDVNAGIREAAARLDSSAAEALWEFMCECGDPACQATATLTLAQYEELRDGGRPLLADGHELDRAARARRSAGERSEEAHAAQAAARLQHRRARKNLKRGGG
jgi:hypothetical protein